MDNIDKFERILNLVERARKLDFIALDVMERMNKHNIDIYNYYNKIVSEKPKSQQFIQEKELMQTENMEDKETYDNNQMKNTRNTENTKDRIEKEFHKKEYEGKGQEMTDHNDALRAFVETFNKQINSIKLNPNPTPPDEDETKEQPQPQPQQQNKDQLFIERIKGLTGTVSDRVKAEADMLKHIHTVITETHRMSFSMWKEMDEYLKKNRTDA